MKNFLFLIVFVIAINCSSPTTQNNEKREQILIDSSKEYSFSEYVNLLTINSKNKVFPNINNIPD